MRCNVLLVAVADVDADRVGEARVEAAVRSPAAGRGGVNEEERILV
jgi:hypothetical protein